jgi:hypothetical protein
MDYRKLESTERIKVRDEYWSVGGEWVSIDTPILINAMRDLRVGNLIIRRKIVLMNRNPTAEELAACLDSHRVLLPLSSRSIGLSALLNKDEA